MRDVMTSGSGLEDVVGALLAKRDLPSAIVVSEPDLR